MIYTVNRFYNDKGQPKRTSKVVISLSNQGGSKGPTEKEARKYGKLIERKEVLNGAWLFVGIIHSDADPELVYKVIANGGAEDEVVLRRTGIDVRNIW